MCKKCELENQEYIVNNDAHYIYIMNNLGIRPQLICGNYDRTDSSERLLINYCSFCGERLVNEEGFYVP